MSIKELNNNDLNNVAGGKDKIKVKFWYYSCDRCGYEWNRYNRWYKPEINPTKSTKCPKCGEKVTSILGEYATGRTVFAEDLAKEDGCPWK